MAENGDGRNLRREDIQAAMAKSMELRALHAALMQGNNSPAHLRLLSSASPAVPRPSSYFSAYDYPVFTPSYEDDPLPGYGHFRAVSQTIRESLDERENENCMDDKAIQLSDYTRPNVSSRKVFTPGLVNLDNHICPADDAKSVASSCTSHMFFVQTSPGTEILKSRRRNSLGDLNSVSSCNKCKPATVSNESNNKSSKYSNIVVPLTDSRAVNNAPENRSRGLVLSWLSHKFSRIWGLHQLKC